MIDPVITRIEVHEYEYTLDNMGRDYNGFNLVYEPGGKAVNKGYIIRILTDQGVAGEFAGGNKAEYSTLPGFAHFLLGHSALQREHIYTEVRRFLRQVARIGFAPVDNALWDLAGRLYDTPINKLLGGYKTKVPCYASTYHGDHQPDGLSSPEAFADFAEQCLEMGYPAFKIHGWGRAPVAQEVANVRAVGKRVGDKMDLMLDPACELTTFGDAVKVGWACDEYKYFWFEDPYRDGGISQFAHRKLRQIIRTPILQTEHVRSLEPHIDFAIADATDYVRGDVGYDGITGVMKLAHACEALGIDIEMHGPGPAQRQCMAAIRNTNYYELGLIHPKAPASHPQHLFVGDYADNLDSIDESGNLPVPQGPGMGVDINWEWVEQNRTDLLVIE